MKCFICNSNCHTIYLYGPSHGEENKKIQAVASQCDDCDWMSNPTKVPGSARPQN